MELKKETVEKAVDSRYEELKVEVATGILPSGIEDVSIKYTFLKDEAGENPKNPYGEGLIKSVRQEKF